MTHETVSFTIIFLANYSKSVFPQGKIMLEVWIRLVWHAYMGACFRFFLVYCRCRENVYLHIVYCI